jgi:hypothetical protein
MSYYKLIGNNVEHFYENVLLPIYGENKSPITPEGESNGDVDWHLQSGDQELRDYTEQFSDMTLTLIVSDSYGTTYGDGVMVQYYYNGTCHSVCADSYVRVDKRKVFDIDKALKAIGFIECTKESPAIIGNCYERDCLICIDDNHFKVRLKGFGSVFTHYSIPTTQLEFDCLMYFIGGGAKPDILNCVKLKDL